MHQNLRIFTSYAIPNKKYTKKIIVINLPESSSFISKNNAENNVERIRCFNSDFFFAISAWRSKKNDSTTETKIKSQLFDKKNIKELRVGMICSYYRQSTQLRSQIDINSSTRSTIFRRINFGKILLYF